MANKKKGETGNNWVIINGTRYYQISKSYGTKKDKSGKTIPNRIYFRGHTKKDAEAKFDAWKERMNLGITETKKSFGIVADEWIDSFFWTHPGTDKTKRKYLAAFLNTIRNNEICNHLPSEITSKMMQNLFNDNVDKGIALSTIKASKNFLKWFYVYLEQEGYCRNIMHSISIPRIPDKSNEEIAVWSDEEIKTILNSFDKSYSECRIKFMVYVAYFTGLRIAEILALKYDDFKSEGIRISRQLNHKAVKNEDGTRKFVLSADEPLKSAASVRTVPMNEILKKELKSHKTWQEKDMLKNGYRTEYLFTTDSGAFYEEANLRRALMRYYKRIGIEHNGRGWHTFRKTFGTNLCRAGVPIQDASVLLGHSDISVTQQYYVNVGLEAKKNAVEKLSNFIS